MMTRRALFLAVCGSVSTASVSTASVSTGVAAPGAKAALSDPMALLPASSRHVFRAAPRGWTQRIEYLRLQDNHAAFIVLEPSARPNLKTDWRQVSYFDSPRETDPNNFRKIRRFRPDGTLALEIDRAATEQFDCRFARDGAVVSYEHLRGTRRIAGYSLDQNTKKVSHFSGGHGDWIEWGEDDTHFTHNWVRDGEFYLMKRGESGRIVETSLFVPGRGELQISSTGEELNLFSMHERWRKQGNQPVFAQIDDYHINGDDASIVKDHFPDDEIKRHIRALQIPLLRPRGGASGRNNRDPRLQKQLEADYLQRRAQFLSRFEAVLKSAGQSWDSLDLGRIAPRA